MATVARTPDAELLRRLRARDRTAWEVLYLEHQPRLRAFAYSLAGNVHDADDLVQETFVRAVPRLDQLDPETTDVSAYLFTTLKNLFLKQVERRKRQEPMADVPEPSVPQPIEDDPQRSLLLRSQQDEVRVANARLQPRQRLVLALRELEDKSYAEIGEMVGMKENAVAQLIFRAREGLRTELRLVQVDPAQLPEECRRFLPLLAAHLDGQLKGKRLDETLVHLEGCERCQAALADMQEASRRYRSVFLLPLAGDDARAAIDERLEASGYWAMTPARRRARRTRNVGALVTAVLVLGGSGGALAVALTDDDVAEAEAVSTSITAPGSTSSALRPATRRSALPPVSTAGPETTSGTSTQGTSTATTAPPTVAPTLPVTERSRPAETTRSKVSPTATTKPQTVIEPPPTSPAPDTKAPVVTITSAPPAAASTDSAQVAFKANETGVTFSCALDAAAATACSSPVALTGLSAGPHTFSVRGTDKAKNAGKQVSVNWTYTPPDTTPPTVTLSSAPAASTTDTSASFQFASSEPGSSFGCSVDGGAFAGCTSPAAYASLAVGAHAFSVTATDAAGNVSQPATHNWTIVTPLPDLLVGSFTKNAITITNRGTASAGPSVLTITLIGTFTVPKLDPGSSQTFSWSICRVGTYSAIVDRTNAVAESDETNNRASRVNTCP